MDRQTEGQTYSSNYNIDSIGILPTTYLEIHQPLPENPLASMVNLPIVGNLPIGAKELTCYGPWLISFTKCLAKFN